MDYSLSLLSILTLFSSYFSCFYHIPSFFFPKHRHICQSCDLLACRTVLTHQVTSVVTHCSCCRSQFPIPGYSRASTSTQAHPCFFASCHFYRLRWQRVARVALSLTQCETVILICNFKLFCMSRLSGMICICGDRSSVSLYADDFYGLGEITDHPSSQSVLHCHHNPTNIKK